MKEKDKGTLDVEVVVVFVVFLTDTNNEPGSVEIIQKKHDKMTYLFR